MQCCECKENSQTQGFGKEKIAICVTFLSSAVFPYHMSVARQRGSKLMTSGAVNEKIKVLGMTDFAYGNDIQLTTHCQLISYTL